MKRSASALVEAGNSIDESIALITAGNTVVQDPDSVGTTLKTLSLRLRGARTELEAAGEDTDGMAQSVSSLRDEMMSLTGVDIMLDPNTFKGTYDILKEISYVWDDLTDVSRANVLEMIAGKRNANVAASIIANFDEAEGALQASLESTGSAVAENEKFMDSLQGKINELTASIESFSTSFLNSDLLKTGISFLTQVMNILDGIAKSGAGFPALLASIAGGLSMIKNVGKNQYALLPKVA